MSIRSRVITIFAVLIILGGVMLGFLVYQASRSRGIELQFSAPEKVTIGVPFDFRINIANSSQNVFEEVRLSVNLPEGLAFLGSPASKTVDFKELGTVSAGGVNQQIYKLIALNGENTFKRITASVSYLSGSLSSRFQEESSFDLSVGSYGLTLDIAAPQKIFSGEAFDAEISYKNVSDIDYSDLKLKMEYPPTFTLIKSALIPDVGNNVWVLGGLRKGSENKFKINGNIIGPEGAFFDLKATIEASFLGQSYPISANSATLSIATSPLSLGILLNEDPEYIARTNDELHYTLSYVNNTDVGLRDVIIRAQLIGTMFDFTQLSSDASFRSTDNTLTWNASNVPELGTLSPGESGTVNFSLKTKMAYPIKRLSDKNFTLKVRGTIESPTVPHFVQAEKTFSVANLETKVAGQVDMDAKVLFRDAASGIINKGPFPPRVNQPTQYTVHWLITDYGTDVKEVEVKAFLAGNVRFTGAAKSSAGTSVPTYNERTQEMVWTIARVPATTGVISRALEATFQIVATPSSSDLGGFMPLIQETAIKAIDEFTNLELTDKDFPVNTSLPDDPTVTSGQGVVVN